MVTVASTTAAAARAHTLVWVVVSIDEDEDRNDDNEDDRGRHGTIFIQFNAVMENYGFSRSPPHQIESFSGTMHHTERMCVCVDVD